MAGQCSVPGCNSSPRRGRASLCEKHYYRLRRTGSTDDPKFATRRQRPDGYIEVKDPKHPLAMASGFVMEHRLVFHAGHGDGPFTCHVCGEPTDWSEMHVDHLNDVVDDNRLENLAAAHPTCNQSRGRHKMARTQRANGVRLSFNGETLCLSEWSRRVGITEASLRWRLRHGWPAERAFMQARGKTGPRKQISS